MKHENTGEIPVINYDALKFACAVAKGDNADVRDIIEAYLGALPKREAQPAGGIRLPEKERCIADDQWAIDAFYEGYDKANADFKANGFTGLKPVIGGIRSLLAATQPAREVGNPNYYQQAKALALENSQLKALVTEMQKDLDIRLDIEKELTGGRLSTDDNR